MHDWCEQGQKQNQVTTDLIENKVSTYYNKDNHFFFVGGHRNNNKHNLTDPKCQKSYLTNPQHVW